MDVPIWVPTHPDNSVKHHCYITWRIIITWSAAPSVCNEAVNRAVNTAPNSTLILLMGQS